jgi:NADPH:quinone reductase-like Zn-dependent oxidoreductase
LDRAAGWSEDGPWLGIGVSEFKRRLAKEFLDGRAGLHKLARRHSLLRNLIRLWIRKYEAGEFTDELAEAVHFAEYERKIVELERKIGQLTIEVDRGVEVVFDTVGGDVSQESTRSLTFGGPMVIVGWAGNTTVAQGGGKRGSDNAGRLPTNIMQMKGLYVMGSPMVIHSGREPATRVPRLESIFKWVGEGRVTHYVSHTFSLAAYRRAMHAKLIGKVNGNCALHPN